MTRRISTLIALFALTLPATAGAAGPHPNGPIVFVGNSKQRSGLWAWSASWKGLRQITHDRTDRDPQGSPNGRWIVFTRVGTSPGVTPSSTDVFLARTDGSQVVQVTSGHSDRSPSFSPSGKRILFSRYEPTPRTELAAEPDSAEELSIEHIYSVRLDGTGLLQLTTGGFADRNPVFSPNGRVIAFERLPLDGHFHVFTMRPDGSGVRDATPQLGTWSSEPAFNPTGSRIVYVRSPPGSINSDLFTMRPDGKAVRRLTGRSGHPLGGVASPSWSPDGTRIVFPGLRVIRVRDRHLGGPQFRQLPPGRSPAWLRR